MEGFLIFLLYFACILLAGWILMLILGAVGLAVGYGTCVLICAGITVLRILL